MPASLTDFVNRGSGRRRRFFCFLGPLQGPEQPRWDGGGLRIKQESAAAFSVRTCVGGHCLGPEKDFFSSDWLLKRVSYSSEDAAGLYLAFPGTSSSLMPLRALHLSWRALQGVSGALCSSGALIHPLLQPPLTPPSSSGHQNNLLRLFSVGGVRFSGRDIGQKL